VEFYTGGVVGSGYETFTRILTGVSDIGHFAPGYTPGVFPMFDIFDYPVRIPNAEVVTRAMLQMYDKGYFDKDFADVKVILTMVPGPFVIHLARHKATTIDDLRGLKLRCSNEGFVNLTKALGGVPATLPAGETVILMQKRIVDGSWTTWSATRSFSLFPPDCKYINDVGMMTLTHVETMNKGTWEALPKAGKDYIEANSKQFSLDYAAAHDEHLEVLRNMYLEKGGEIIHFAPGEYEKMTPLIAPIWDKWMADREAKGLPARQMIDDYYQIATGLGVDHPVVGYTPE